MSATVLCCPVLNSHTHVNSEAVNRNTDSIHAFWTENTECIHSSTVTQLFSKGVSVTRAGSSKEFLRGSLANMGAAGWYVSFCNLHGFVDSKTRIKLIRGMIKHAELE